MLWFNFDILSRHFVSLLFRFVCVECIRTHCTLHDTYSYFIWTRSQKAPDHVISACKQENGDPSISKNMFL